MAFTSARERVRCFGNDESEISRFSFSFSMYIILVSINKREIVNFTKDEEATSILAGFYACSQIFRREGIAW